MSRFFLLVTLAPLTACGAAEEAFDREARNQIVQRCEGLAEGLGIVAEQVSPVCGCSADKLLEKDLAQLGEIDSARLSQIVSECQADLSDVSAAG